MNPTAPSPTRTSELGSGTALTITSSSTSSVAKPPKVHPAVADMGCPQLVNVIVATELVGTKLKL